MFVMQIDVMNSLTFAIETFSVLCVMVSSAKNDE